jgi:hypothetical protein
MRRNEKRKNAKCKKKNAKWEAKARAVESFQRYFRVTHKCADQGVGSAAHAENAR